PMSPSSMAACGTGPMPQNSTTRIPERTGAQRPDWPGHGSAMGEGLGEPHQSISRGGVRHACTANSWTGADVCQSVLRTPIRNQYCNPHIGIGFYVGCGSRAHAVQFKSLDRVRLKARPRARGLPRPPGMTGAAMGRNVMGKTIRIAGILLAASCSALPSIALPQGQAAAGGDEGAITSSDDIIVTARRREERLQDVPQAIIAFNSEQLTRANVTEVPDLVRITPGLVFQPNSLSNKSVSLTLRAQRQNLPN